jgi:hypothetical protein
MTIYWDQELGQVVDDGMPPATEPEGYYTDDPATQYPGATESPASPDYPATGYGNNMPSTSGSSNPQLDAVLKWIDEQNKKVQGVPSGNQTYEVGNYLTDQLGIQKTQLALTAASQKAQEAYNMAMLQHQDKVLALQAANQAFTQEMSLANLMSNPRNLTAALSMMGLSQPEIGSLLSKSPLVQSLIGRIGAEGGQVNATPTPIGSAPQALTGANGASLTGVAGSTRQAPWAGGATVGTNPDFNFIKGRQLPMMGMAQAVKTNSPVLGLLGGLAEYSGQDSSNFFGDYQAALPQGQRSPLTRTI